MELTYCNPLSIPHVEDGRWLDCALTGKDIHDFTDYRSISDPSVIYWEGKWILYPSYSMAYVTEDFVHWQHVDIGLHDVTYSPAVTCFRGKWYLFGHFSTDFYCADSPLGKFEKIGDLTDIHGQKHRCADGCLLADGDRLYVFWTSGRSAGPDEDLEFVTQNYGAELDPEKPWQMITEPVLINEYDPETEWERLGEYNQNERVGWIEGPWAIKKNGRYYFLYSACGTEYGAYAQGVLISEEGPLTGYRRQKKHDPLTRKRTGLIRGAGHGSLVEGPNGTLWVFYTNVFCLNHLYERRISMDPVGIDEDGELYCRELTETPQFAPGILPHPENGNSAGLLPLTFLQRACASSCAPGRDAFYACDESVFSFWQPAENDPEPVLTVPFTLANSTAFLVSGIRIIWRDVGMEVTKGICPGPFHYTVEYDTGNGWETVIDASENREDLCIDYRQFEPVSAYGIRLRILGAPEGIAPGVVSLTAFGRCHRNKKEKKIDFHL